MWRVHTAFHCIFLFSLFHMHSGEECELTCRESNNEVVILPSNMTAEGVLREHWRNPHKVKVSVCLRLRPPRSPRRRTSHDSAIHSFPVRNFARGVNILAASPTAWTRGPRSIFLSPCRCANVCLRSMATLQTFSFYFWSQV